MALSELELKRCQKAMRSYIEANRPPPEIRSQLDLGYRISGQSVEIFEIRPDWKDPTEKMENPVAKSTFVRRSGLWRIYWQRADLKWHRYEPVPEVESLIGFLEVVEADEFCCFFG